MPELMLKCVDCKSEFAFTEGEQEYFRDRGLAIPKRCNVCRLKRRQGIGLQSINVPEPKIQKKEEVKEPLKNNKSK